MGCRMLTWACLLLVIQSLLVSTSTGLKPGRFRKEILSTTSEVKSAEENTWLNFTFSIRHSPNWTSFSLYNRNIAQCTIRNNKSVCSVGKGISVCSCSSKEGEYIFAKRVNRIDNSLWTWKEFINNTVTGNGTITFNISYPTIVTNLTVQGYTYKEDDFYTVAVNNSAQVVCTWITGNPPTAVHLKDENGTLIHGEPYAEILTYNISAIRCNSVVKVVCDSINSDGNPSVKILTECFPELIDHTKRIRQSVQGQSVVLEFQMYSYSHITQCQIIHYKDENSFNAMIYECKTTQGNYYEPDFEKCWCTIIGRTPNRSVTIYIYNVSKDDNGLWQVNVSTSLGSVHFNFSLPVLNEMSTPTHFILQVGVSVGAGALSITVIIICIIVVIKMRKKIRRRSVTSPYQTTTPPRTESDKSSSKTSSYNEVDDLELTARIREEAESVEYTRPSPPTAHAHSTRSHAERLTAVPPEAVTIEQAARAQQPEYVEIENEVRPNGDDGYLVPAGQYASLNPATRSEEGHEYENLGSKPTEPSSTPGYSGLVKSTKREKHLYDRLKRETNQTVEAEEDEPAYAIALEQMPGPTFTKL